MEQLIAWDKALLLLVNGANGEFFDNFFYAFSGVAIWVPLALLIVCVIAKTKHREALWILLCVVLLALVSDQFSCLIKQWVARPRPTHEPTLAGLVHIVQGYVGGRYGFVSSHAANSFAFALFTSLLIKNRYYSITIFAWALVNCYSRMYLGVHYPCDVLAGGTLGALLGWGMFAMLKWLRPQALRTTKEGDSHFTSTGFSFISIYGIVAAMLLTVLAIALTSIG